LIGAFAPALRVLATRAARGHSIRVARHTAGRLVNIRAAPIPSSTLGPHDLAIDLSFAWIAKVANSEILWRPPADKI
jgi:hypothetical protein